MTAHLRESWRKLAWHPGTDIRGYPIPQGGQFAMTKEFLDPDIFDSKERMHPWIRGAIISILDSFWRPRYGDWQSWTRLYLAGSLASYWWGTPDFDTLVGVDTEAFASANKGFEGMTDAEVCTYLTHEFYVGLDPLLDHFTFPPAPDLVYLIRTLKAMSRETPTEVESLYADIPSGIKPLGPLEITFYVNAAAYDIRSIKPYAAYELLSDSWYVHPQRMDRNWGAKAMGWNFWMHMADVADEIRKILSIPNPQERHLRASQVYERIHSQRNEAFSPQGGGVTDTRSLQWIVLSRWGLLGALEKELHPDRPVAHLPPALAAIAEKYR